MGGKEIMKCAICNRDLRFDKKKGWYHLDTGTYVICRCKDCGHEDSSVFDHCPVCGSSRWVDDHVATPDYSGK